MNALEARIRQASDATLLEMITLMGNGILLGDKAMVRAGLYTEYERREGGDAVDVLLVTMGMAV